MENNTVEKIKELCLNGLSIDGGHHKQWYLEQILQTLIDDKLVPETKLQDFQEDEVDEDGEVYSGEWEEGIAP